MLRWIAPPLALALAAVTAALAGAGIAYGGPARGVLGVVGAIVAPALVFGVVSYLLVAWRPGDRPGLAVHARQAWVLYACLAWSLWVVGGCALRVGWRGRCDGGSIPLAMLFGGAALIGIVTHAAVTVVVRRRRAAGRA